MYHSGKPELMKQMNMTLLYRALLSLGSATRVELADKTRISLTTVRALLEKLLQRGEVIGTEWEASSGGRRAQRYSLHPQRNWILSFYLAERALPYCVRGCSRRH